MKPRGAFGTVAIAYALGAALVARESAAGFVAAVAGNALNKRL
jgi:hypothetical protein